MTVAKYGSSTRPRPNASITIIVSTGAAAETAMRFRERQAEQAEFGVLLPDGAAPAVWFGHVLLALLELVLIGDQPIDAVLQQTLFVGEIEVHAFVSASTVRSRIG